MDLERQQYDQDIGGASRVGSGQAGQPADLPWGLELARYVVLCRGTTLRVVLLTLLSLAALTTAALALAVFFAPSALLPLAVLAGGSTGIGGYLLLKVSRGGSLPDLNDSVAAKQQADARRTKAMR